MCAAGRLIGLRERMMHQRPNNPTPEKNLKNPLLFAKSVVKSKVADGDKDPAGRAACD